jgi:hypothetical protein
MLLLASIPLP